jgi:hypothetical protein
MKPKAGKKRAAKPRGFITRKNARQIGALRETFGGGRPRVPTECGKCGMLHPSARMAQACLHPGSSPPGLTTS